jgi:hypothetical protein
MISFRLTPQEFDRFCELSNSYGLRSVSELVRAAVNLMAGQPRPPEPLLTPETQARIAAIEFRLANLCSAFAQIESRLSADISKIGGSAGLAP